MRHHTVADKTTRVVAVVTVSGLTALAGWISYHHMLLLAKRSGQTGVDAHAFPLTVDGLDLIGVLVLLADRRTGRRSGWLPWTVLAVGTVASISANIAVAPDNLVARAISGWSAIALLAAAKMLAHLFEPAEPTDRPPRVDTAAAVATAPVTTTGPASSHDSVRGTLATPPDDNPVAAQRRSRRHVHAAAGRVPTTSDAYGRWCAIWAATRDLPAATRDVARANGVSLRTLQFIRSAGEAGQLAAPTDRPTAPPEPVPASAPDRVDADTSRPDPAEPQATAVTAVQPT